MSDTLKTLRRLAPEAAEALERADRFDFVNSSAATQALFIVHCSADVHCLCTALAEALAALEPLARVGRSLNSGVGLKVSDGHKALIAAGDARRAARVLEKVQ